jgi:hypothetical protein
MFATFPPGRNLHSLILCQKARTWILTVSEALFWKGSKPMPLLRPENRLWGNFIAKWTTVNYTILTDERKLNEIWAIQWGLPQYSPDIASSDFWSFSWSKREMKGQICLSKEADRTFSLKYGEKWIPVNFSACLINVSAGLNMLSNQKGVQCQINTFCFDWLHMNQNREVNWFLAILCFWSLAQNQTVSHRMQNIMAVK